MPPENTHFIGPSRATRRSDRFRPVRVVLIAPEDFEPWFVDEAFDAYRERRVRTPDFGSATADITRLLSALLALLHGDALHHAGLLIPESPPTPQRLALTCSTLTAAPPTAPADHTNPGARAA